MREKIGEGRTATIYKIEPTKVLKEFHKGFGSFSKHEFEITRKISNLYSGTPKVFDYIETQDTKSIVYEYIPGKSMLSLLLQNPFRVKSLGKKMAREHFAVHQVKTQALSSLKDNLMKSLSYSKDLTKKEVAVIQNYLKTLPEENRLCHYDFHPDNLIIKDETIRVIDWMTACCGPPAADVCRTGFLILYSSPPPGTNVFMKLLIRLFNKKFYQYYISEYKRLSGMTQEEIDFWFLPVAASRLSSETIEEERDNLLALVKKQLNCKNTP